MKKNEEKIEEEIEDKSIEKDNNIEDATTISDISKYSLETLEGLGKEKIKALKEAGIYSLLHLAKSYPKNIESIKGISDITAKKLIDEARKRTGIGKVVTGADLMRDEENVVRISTGSNTLDTLLTPVGANKGGIASQEITEAYGKNASGKTEQALTLMAMVQLPIEQGGLNGKAVLLDSETTFRASRFREIAEKRGLNPDEALKNIYVFRCSTSDLQEDALNQTMSLMMDDPAIKLIVVDSLTKNYRAEFLGREWLARRQQALSKFLDELQTISDVYNIPVFITNQVMDKPDSMPFQDPTTPIGGNVVGHKTVRMYYRRAGREGKRIVRLVDSPYLAEGEAVVVIKSCGISDEEKE